MSQNSAEVLLDHTKDRTDNRTDDRIETIVKLYPTVEEALLKYGIDYQDSKGFTFLHHYALVGKVGQINKLLAAGSFIDILDNEGRTALYYSHNEEIAEFLLKRHICYKSIDNHGETADEHNEYVNYIVHNKCKDRFKKIYKGFGT